MYVDGRLHQIVSCTAPSRSTQRSCARIAGLTQGDHELEVIKLSGELLTLDALQVYDAG